MKQECKMQYLNLTIDNTLLLHSRAQVILRGSPPSKLGRGVQEEVVAAAATSGLLSASLCRRHGSETSLRLEASPPRGQSFSFIQCLPMRRPLRAAAAVGPSARRATRRHRHSGGRRICAGSCPDRTASPSSRNLVTPPEGEENNIVNLKQIVACLYDCNYHKPSMRLIDHWMSHLGLLTNGSGTRHKLIRTNPARASKSRPSVEYPWETYTLKELLQATANFSESNKLGEGGFGTVYWGRTSKGVEIAVKRLKAMTAKAEMEFAVEVEILGRVRHRNLLSQRGFYAGGDERLIVYDYMPNHSLLTHLHPHRGTPSSQQHVPLEWPRRVAIAVGAAEGLSYLHHEVSPHIIHRDIKASNVLLDAEFVPKVADFGFAKLIPDGVSHLTTRVKGTLGYLAPEYAMWGKVSESCDVYSFGVLLLELVSARRPLEKLPGGVKREIVQWAAPLVERRKWERLADPRLAGRFDAVQLRAMVDTAMLCTQNNAESRPTMAEVVDMLRFGGGERRTKEIVPVAPVAGSSDEITTTTDQDDVTAGSSEPLDRRNWKLTKLR